MIGLRTEASLFAKLIAPSLGGALLLILASTLCLGLSQVSGHHLTNVAWFLAAVGSVVGIALGIFGLRVYQHVIVPARHLQELLRETPILRDCVSNATSRTDIIRGVAAQVEQIRDAVAEREERQRQLQGALERSLQDLAESHRELQHRQFALDAAAIVDVTDASGVIQYVNERYCAVSGYDRHELIGQNHSLVSARHHTPQFWRSMYEAIYAGEVWRAEVKNRSKQGDYFWLDSTIVPRRGSDGRISHFMAIRFDITERKVAEERLKLAVEASRAGLWDWDIEQGTFFTNDQFHLMLGREPQCDRWPIGWFFDNLHPDDLGATTKAVEAAHHSDDYQYSVEFRLRCGDESYRWIRSLGKVVDRDGQGNPRRMIGQHVDITDIKCHEELMLQAMNEAETASRSKSEFLANMSHEIRTPLTAILGYADLLIDESQPAEFTPETRETCQTIKRNGEHLLTIINDILDLSKIEADKLAIEQLDVSPVEIVEEVWSLNQLRADGKNLKFRVQYLTPVPSTIQTDPVRLRQILINLVGNAIKFTDFGSVVIQVAFDPTDPHATHMTFDVIDTGMGMSPDQLSRLFRAFEQGDTSTTRRFGGTGLGLMISHRLAAMLGGSLQVESAAGKGSRFQLTLNTGPAASLLVPRPGHGGDLTKQNPSVPTDRSNRSSSTTLAGLHILLVEDGPDNQRLISHILRKAGADVSIAENGRRAIELFTVDGNVESALREDCPTDVILMDMQMPVMDGYSATRLLRSKGCSIPIIALTAHAMDGERKRCLESGCNDYATKPIDRHELIERTAQWGRSDSGFIPVAP